MSYIMYMLIFLLIIVGYNCDIKIVIDDLKDDYNISINNRIWLRSSYTSLYNSNQWFTTKNNESLHLIGKNFNEGDDLILGQWNETEFIYNFNSDEKSINVTGRIRQWKLFSAITFYFDNDLFDLNNDILLDMDRVRTVFPSFYIEKFKEDDQRAYFTFAGMMLGDLEKHAGIWDSKSHFEKSGMSGGPFIIFNSTQNGQGDAILISPFSQFMSSSLSINGNILEYGYMGSIKTIPKNSTNSLIIFYSSNGINQLIDEWGKLMRLVYNKTLKYRSDDLTINYLGYYTDNGAYYYYHTESQMNYEETIIEIKKNLTIPIQYIQLDSWWYYKSLADGVSEWTARPDIFPDGLEGLNKKLTNLPLAAHNRYWSSDTIYTKNYSFIIDNLNLKSLPLGNDSFWIDLFNYSSTNWNLILYEQDWMNHQTIDFIPTRQEFDLGRQWLISMGNAANLFNINIQYCMSLPRHALQSLEIDRVTQARVSDDYYVHIVNKIPQWKIGISSMLANALGLAPFKDVFWSNSIQPGAPYKVTAREPLPDREILIATLSTGPVAVADSINYIDNIRIMKCCRQDGLILKPSRPLTMIDLLISDWALYKGFKQGELYSTQTIINEQIFSIIFASSMIRNYSIIPSMIGSPSGIIWSFDNPYELFTFDENHSLFISTEKCNDTTFCLWYSSPIWQFNDSLSTKYVFMGELNKWTFVSQQRFSSLNLNSENTQMTIIINGAPNELVDVFVYHSKFESIIHLVCSLSNSNAQAQLIINPVNVTCV
ncbi:unnamed protein product [Adineta steineri]|uniref:Uncharacterized protein n=3 Tax=Adineta steineri TaxID=433720 RepID=A0A814U4U5_9BILA|nr:unnamed protein product [Adineta steineri]CAF1169880.1 unnamed protein product [Adineta steineri]